MVHLLAVILTACDRRRNPLVGCLYDALRSSASQLLDDLVKLFSSCDNMSAYDYMAKYDRQYTKKPKAMPVRGKRRTVSALVRRPDGTYERVRYEYTDTYTDND